jgi:carboxypeptidase Taq
MSATFAPYLHLLDRSRETALLGSINALLGWDQETGMPPKAITYRAQQQAFLSGRIHRLFTDPEVGDWIKACEDHGFAPGSGEAANVREWRLAYDRATKLPASLVEEFEKATSFGRQAWMEARQKSDFSLFAPHLRTILDLTRRKAHLWGFADSPYDALLEGYEPGTRARDIRTLFATLAPVISGLLPTAAEKSARTPAGILDGDYPVDRQIAFNREVAAAFGFDFEAGRIDTTTHPFCSGMGPRDCRLTTRYDTRNFTVSFYGVLHECGHGLYEQGLPEDAYGTPLGEAVSLGIHESQSRFWENHIGRGESFWNVWLPIAARHFPHLARLTPEQMHAAVNRVSPSFIRVEADEVTYDLHIILRFEIELALVEGTLQIDDLPAAWNERFASLFGLTVPDDARGCLQDIHWSMGGIGYFPTYTLGNLNASQLEAAALREQPSLATDLAAGHYGTTLAWLRHHIHRYGRHHHPGELMTLATGTPTQPEPHLAYLRKKFL